MKSHPPSRRVTSPARRRAGAAHALRLRRAARRHRGHGRRRDDPQQRGRRRRPGSAATSAAQRRSSPARRSCATSSTRPGHHRGSTRSTPSRSARRTTRASSSSGSSSWRTRSPSSPTADRDIYVQVVSDFLRSQLLLAEVGAQEPQAEGHREARRRRVRQRGQQARRAAWAKKNIDVEIDPRYDPGTSGKAGGGDGSISRPVSPYAKRRVRRPRSRTSSPRSRPSCAAADLVTLPVVEHPLPAGRARRDMARLRRECPWKAEQTHAA